MCLRSVACADEAAGLEDAVEQWKATILQDIEQACRGGTIVWKSQRKRQLRKRRKKSQRNLYLLRQERLRVKLPLLLLQSQQQHSLLEFLPPCRSCIARFALYPRSATHRITWSWSQSLILSARYRRTITEIIRRFGRNRPHDRIFFLHPTFYACQILAVKHCSCALPYQDAYRGSPESVGHFATRRYQDYGGHECQW